MSRYKCPECGGLLSVVERYSANSEEQGYTEISCSDCYYRDTEWGTSTPSYPRGWDDDEEEWEDD